MKEISGKTAGEWIDSLVVLEAKALLKSSELSIQEIADELHFANQSFFGKYFKQMCIRDSCKANAAASTAMSCGRIQSVR